jgi:ABC-type multidrug transport system fused ATPase/permease subunit
MSGRELRDVSRAELRRRVAVIPQHPLLLPGSLRFNLDPRGQFNDARIMQALHECRYLETLATNSNSSTTSSSSSNSSNLSMQSIGGGGGGGGSVNGGGGGGSGSGGGSGASVGHGVLDAELAEGGAGLSAGQRQLLVLGRLLLQQASLLLIDEATASVDHRTEALLFEALRRYLDRTGATLLLICHKMRNVAGLCDKVGL